MSRPTLGEHRYYSRAMSAPTPVEPKPAASIVLVRPAPPESPEPIEVYMIRRRRSMKFLGGYYAFPGGKVDPEDGSPAAVARCRGLASVDPETIFPGHDTAPALAFWVAAVRELLEESGILLACDAHGRPLDAREPAVAARIERCRKALMAGEAPFAELLAREGWDSDLSGLRYLSHFITPARARSASPRASFSAACPRTRSHGSSPRRRRK